MLGEILAILTVLALSVVGALFGAIFITIIIGLVIAIVRTIKEEKKK